MNKLRAGSLLGLLCAVAASGEGLALTRDGALATASEYLLALYDVTSANVYPAVSCYDPSNPRYMAKLDPGSYVGLPYSYREGEPFTYIDIVGHLYDDGRGAGSSYDLAMHDYPCVRDHVTGIDCSQLVSAAWQQVPRFNTGGLNSSIAVLLAGSASVKAADAFCLSGSHVVLFATQIGTDGLFTSYEANGSAGQAIIQTDRSYNTYYNAGYRPWCSKKLKDDPAADVFALSAGRRDGQIVVAWQTLLERDTEGFRVERSASADGPFGAVSDVIARRGGDTSGASYEFIDAGYPGGAVYYQLREIEMNGRELLHGVTGPVSLMSEGKEH